MRGEEDATASSAGEPGPPREVIASRYEVETVLGRGGMGEVLRAFDTHLKRRVAIKRLHEETRNERREKRFLREARVMARLRHPHVVEVHDFGIEPDGALFLVMEMVEGESLARVLERDGRLAPRVAANVARQLAGALAAAHEVDVIHRDVKPDNVLVGPHGAKLTDFGVAKDEATSTEITAKGALVGTVVYMPPEQVRGEVDARSDIYALGATLYEMLVGKPPFSGTREVLLQAILEVAPVPPRKLVPEIPADLERVVLRCLEKSPEARFATARELEAALAACCEKRHRPLWPVFLFAGLAFVAGAVATAAAFVKSKPVLERRPVVVVDAADEHGGGAFDVACLVSAGVATRCHVTVLQGAASPVAGDATFDASGRAKLELDVPAAPFRIVVEAFDLEKRVASAEKLVRAPRKGWFSEFLPRGMRMASENGVYVWDTGKGLEIEMVYVPPGEFTMGVTGPENDCRDARPSHRHSLPSGYWVGRSETTWREYRIFCTATRRAAPQIPAGWTIRDSHPVVGTTWFDAKAFCDWAGLRLPTEPEWEKAARGSEGARNIFPWGSDWVAGLANFSDVSCPNETSWKDRNTNDGFGYTAPVGSFPGGASPCGALDMGGNIGEWCEDWYDDGAYARYARGRFELPVGGDEKVCRGGSWNDPWWNLRTYSRGHRPANDVYVGFRPARSFR